MGNSPYSTLLLIVVMVVAFYLLILRPQRKRQQAQARTVNALTPGTRVVTGSGLYGTLVEVGDKQVVMEISPGAQLTVLKQAIVRVVPAGEEDADVPGVGGTYSQVDDVAYGETGTEDEAYAPEPSHDFRRSTDSTTDTQGLDPGRPRDNS